MSAKPRDSNPSIAVLPFANMSSDKDHEYFSDGLAEEILKCACTVKTAGKPPQPIEKSVAGASLLAQVIVSKIADHLPVHRQARIFSRFGVEIPDQTMGGWMRQSAELLEPLYVRLKQFVLSSKVVGTDDTPVKVLDRKLKRSTRRGRFWPYIGDREHPAAVFDYTPTRERAGPEMFLQSYRGYLLPLTDTAALSPVTNEHGDGCSHLGLHHPLQLCPDIAGRLPALLVVSGAGVMNPVWESLVHARESPGFVVDRGVFYNHVHARAAERIDPVSQALRPRDSRARTRSA